MRHSRCDSGAIQSCAAHHGVTPRAVRDWRKNDDPRWRAWLSRAARSVEQLDAFAQAQDSPTDPTSETEAARRRFAILSRMVDEATSRKEVSSLPVLIRAAQEAQRLLQSCRAAEVEWQEARRRTIPVSEFHDYKARFIEPMMAVLKNLPLEAAETSNPERPDLAREALEHWLQNRFRAHWQEAQAALDAVTAQPL